MTQKKGQVHLNPMQDKKVPFQAEISESANFTFKLAALNSRTLSKAGIIERILERVAVDKKLLEKLTK